MVVWPWLFKFKVIHTDHWSWKMTYFGETTGPRSPSIQHYSGGQILAGEKSVPVLYRKLWRLVKSVTQCGIMCCDGNQVSNVGKCTRRHKMSYLRNKICLFSLQWSVFSDLDLEEPRSYYHWITYSRPIQVLSRYHHRLLRYDTRPMCGDEAQPRCML